MKSHTRFALLGLCLAALSLPFGDRAATVWSGPLITYTQPDPDPTQSSNQDQLTPNVALTRAVSAGLFNAVSETAYTHHVSPADTEWAIGSLANYATLAYTDWETLGGGNPVLNLPGQQLVVHLISDDIYLSLSFNALGGHLAGGFSYERSTPATVNVGPIVTIDSPTNGAAFTAPANVAITATAIDSDGSVANVAFFDGPTFLGSTNNPPYTITATLALGGHSLTAIASDNFGLATTSPVVNVTVITNARYLPAITNGNIVVFLQPIATGLAAPDYAISPPGDTNRLFVIEQNGLVRIIQNGTLVPGAALDIQNRVQPPLVASNAGDERGLLGLAFHPGFTNPVSPGYRTLYTYNSEMIPEAAPPTYPAPNAAPQTYKNVVNEWKLSTTNDSVVDPASRREILSFGKSATNHNGGTIAFGPDGYLYLGLGDGGDANDVGPSHLEPGGNAQNLSTPLGKMLRLDPLNPALTAASSDRISSNGQYRIPTSNPFQAAGQVPEIYAYGLRNPYRFSFDRANGDLIQADVGQNNIEEIDRIVRGGNYGWAIKEGDFLFNRADGTIGAPPGNRSPGSPAGLIDPIRGPLGTLEYDHNDGISITGGFVYRGKAIPELFGKCVFGDLAPKAAPARADGRIFYADLQSGSIEAFPLPQFATEILPNGLTVHGFGEDADGELYALVTNTSANGTGGIVYKLVALRLTTRVTGNQLEISWPVSGGRLEMQALGPGAGLGTNWITVQGYASTNRVVVPINSSGGSAFYRLAVP